MGSPRQGELRKQSWSFHSTPSNLIMHDSTWAPKADPRKEANYERDNHIYKSMVIEARRDRHRAAATTPGRFARRFPKEDIHFTWAPHASEIRSHLVRELSAYKACFPHMQPNRTLNCTRSFLMMRSSSRTRVGLVMPPMPHRATLHRKWHLKDIDYS